VKRREFDLVSWLVKHQGKQGDHIGEQVSQPSVRRSGMNGSLRCARRGYMIGELGHVKIPVPRPGHARDNAIVRSVVVKMSSKFFFCVNIASHPNLRQGVYISQTNQLLLYSSNVGTQGAALLWEAHKEEEYGL
jgi:hypothetical protein